MIKQFLAAALVVVTLAGCSTNNTENMEKQTTVVQEWDKTFPLSDKVTHSKVCFKTNYGFTLVGDVYVPKDASGRMPAVAVCGPYGAVKEQVSGRYAMVLAERGYVTVAFDPSFTGESSGEPRRMSSPDINTEDFLAAVDYLEGREDVDAGRIGVLGVCGWGGIALNAASVDTRIRATVASTMYDMTRVTCNGYNDASDNEAWRYEQRRAVSDQRTADRQSGEHKRGGGVPTTLPADAPQFMKDYMSYYTTERGYHVRSGGSTDGWNVVGQQAYMNARFLHFTNEIRSAVLLVHGEKAHSRYFSEDAFAYMTAGNPVVENKELYIVPGASHCDLYDGGVAHSAGDDPIIPWDKIASFFDCYLGK